MSTTLVVMQPTVLPWAGYFNLMHMADDFVFHDDIQLEKRSWQTRNRLLFNGKAEWISLPIEHTGEKQKISETRVILDKKWTDKVYRDFLRNYGQHPYFIDAAELMDCFLNCTSDKLAMRNEATIRLAAERLKIHPRIYRASEIGVEGVRSDRLIRFCHHFRSATYLSPLGSFDYLQADHFSERAPSVLSFQNYAVLPYAQFNCQEFISHLSIIDVVANLGWEMAQAYVIGNCKNLDFK